MGWWKCNCNGGIDWQNKPTGHPGEHALINAIPDRDSTEDYYNGDAPADTMYVPIAILKSWFINREPKPIIEQLTKLFTEKVFDNVFKHIDKQKLNELIDMTWKEIDEIYKEAWNRPTYPEERVYICSFSFGGAIKIPKLKRDWWDIRKIDEGYIKEFNEGKRPYWWRTS
jgi:hypothetical protein